MGYNQAVETVKRRSLEEDLELIDDLFGRDNLKYGDGPMDVKAEALRQLEREWRPIIRERMGYINNDII